MAVVEHARDGIPHLAHAVGVEVRGRFVEQQQLGAHGEHPGERQPLLLPAGETRGRMIERQVETDRVEGHADAPPDLVARHAQVLAAEGHVIPHPRENHLRVGVLQHQAGRGGGERPLHLAVVLVAEHAGETLEQRGLAGSGCPEQQHALPRLDDQVEPAHRPRGAAGGTPAPAARDDRRPGHGRHGQAVLPAANRVRAPVRASAFARYHDPRPAMTAPDTIAQAR